MDRQESDCTPAPSDNLKTTLDSEQWSNSKISHFIQQTSVSHQLSTPSSERFDSASLSRVERYALAMIESQVIKLGETESFWTSLSSQGVRNLEDVLELDFPPFFTALCVCDATLKGSPICLTSSDNSAKGPRTLDVGAVRFLNLPDLGKREQCRLLTASPGADKKPRFIIELITMLLEAANERSSGYALVARMDVTESVLALAKRLLERYEIGGTHSHDKHLAMLLLDQTDWQIAARDPIPAMRDRLAYEFRAPVPLGDPDVIEFHRFMEDMVWFHRDAFILSPSSMAWQITHISTSLTSAKTDVRQGLSHNAPAMLQELGRGLAGNNPLSRAIQWGPELTKKRLYCVPMFRRERHCWVCFLLDSSIPDLWRDLTNSVQRDGYQ